jgi:hypothetical protein
MLCKFRGSHGGDYEECRLLGYKNPVCISQETHYISTTQSRFEVFTGVTLKNGVFWDVTPWGSCKKRFGGNYRLHHQGEKIW